jgi:hypothetical protein
MRPGDIDRILADEEEILPSSGFAASVIEALRRQVVAPPPIPFPWRRAWLGLTAGALALFVVPAALLGPLARAAAARSSPSISMPLLTSLLRPAADLGAQWVTLALLLTLASIVFAKRIAGGKV